VLLVSTTIGTLGSGRGGGVELTVLNVARALVERGHKVAIVAAEGSVAPGFDLLTVAGEPPAPAQHEPRNAPVVMPADSLVANFFWAAHRCQERFDIIVSFAYDWLAYFLTPFFQTPLAHVVGMSSLSDALDQVLARVAHQLPGRLAVHTRAQAATFDFADDLVVVGNGLDLSGYDFQAQSEPVLGWVARIAPEKGLEDAAAAAEASGLPLRVWGVIEDESYWSAVSARFPPAVLNYRGFLPTPQLQAELGKCRALLATHHWVEAFGNVVAESLAVGVPVISYRRGGPAELVRHGETGFLVEADSVAGLTAAVARIGELDRLACRQQAEAEFSLAALGRRFEAWLTPLLS
jgi:UDP-glucose:tetrahydrobiopterin glucosyltransferase